MVVRFGFMWMATAEKASTTAEKASTYRLPVIVWSASSRTASCTRSCQRMRTAGPLRCGSWATTPSARRIGLVLSYGRRTFRLVNFVSVINVNILVRLQGLQAAAARIPWLFLPHRFREAWGRGKKVAKRHDEELCLLRPPFFQIKFSQLAVQEL